MHHKFLIIFVILCSLLGCTKSVPLSASQKQLNVGVQNLASGTEIVITNISKVDFRESGPGLVLNYKTSIPIEEKDRLRKEVDEIWRFFQADAEAENVKGAIIRAVHDEVSSGVITKGKGFGFVFEKANDGTWHCTADKKGK